VAKSDAWLKDRQGEWARLGGYADRLAAGGLDAKDVGEFVRLYRRATSDLARARTLGVRSEVVDYLNRLVGRVHFQIYTTPSWRWSGIGGYFAAGFPQAVRRQWRWVVTAAALLLVPWALAYAAVQVDPPLGRVFAGPFYDNIGHYDETGRTPGQVAAATSFYIFNNVQVSFLAFAFGALFGLGSACILMTNGATLGAMTALIAQHGQSGPFWSFVAAHGGIEMTAIVLAGAAGMMVGSKLVNPGPFGRGRALIEAGREAARMLFGVIAMLCLAAGIEAAISPSTLPGAIKIALGISNLALVVLYFTLVGRGSESRITGDGRSSPARDA